MAAPTSTLSGRSAPDADLPGDARSGPESGVALCEPTSSAGRMPAPPPVEEELFAETDRTTLENGFDRPGSDYRSFAVPSGNYRTGCQRACQTDGRCQAWTFVKPTKICYLKNGLPAKRRDPDMVSGIRFSLLGDDLNR